MMLFKNTFFLIIILFVFIGACSNNKTTTEAEAAAPIKSVVKTDELKSLDKPVEVRVENKKKEKLITKEDGVLVKEDFIDTVAVKKPPPTKPKSNPLSNKKEGTVFRINPNDPLPLQYTSHKIKNDDRDKHWHSRDGEYFFSEVWTFIYKNELLSKGDFGYEGEFKLYIDAKTGTVLVDNRQRDMISDEKIDFVVVHSDGRYFEAFLDANGKKGLKKLGLGSVRATLVDATNIETNFNKNGVALGEEKQYGDKKGLTLRGRGYEILQEDNNKTTVHLARIPMSALPLYMMNSGNAEAQLPIPFDFAQMVPANFWILEEYYEIKNKTVSFYLKNISSTKLSIDLKEYR